MTHDCSSASPPENADPLSELHASGPYFGSEGSQVGASIMGSVTSASLDRAHSLIRETPDFPQPGILFRDITPLLTDADALATVVDDIIAPFAGEFDLVAGVEARGFLLAAAAAIRAGVGVLPIRKEGKTPHPAAKVSYALEYGTATIEAGPDVPAGARVLLVDDVLATGGTLKAAHQLIEELGGTVSGTAVLFELSELNGRQVVGDKKLHAVFSS